MPGLCVSCAHRREIISGKGTRFLLCKLSQTDHRFPKYPPQPMRDCRGFEKSIGEPENAGAPIRPTGQF
jgi:hypothetical protein